MENVLRIHFVLRTAAIRSSLNLPECSEASREVQDAVVEAIHAVAAHNAISHKTALQDLWLMCFGGSNRKARYPVGNPFPIYSLYSLCLKWPGHVYVQMKVFGAQLGCLSAP